MWWPATPTRGRRWARMWRWPRSTAWWTVFEAGLRGLVGHHVRAAVGEAGRGRVGPPPVLGRDGPAEPGGPGRDRDAGLRWHDRPVRPGPGRRGPGHDELRHLH